MAILSVLVSLEIYIIAVCQYNLYKVTSYINIQYNSKYFLENGHTVIILSVPVYVVQFNKFNTSHICFPIVSK